VAEYDVLVFGDTAVDLIIGGADVIPEFGQVEKLVERYTLELGGSCCIFASQAAKLGLKVGMLGKVGADAFGQLVIERLNAAGVDTQRMVVDPALQTGLTIHLTTNHDRAMLTYLGSLNTLTPADVTDEFLAAGRHLHYGSLYLHSGLLPAWLDILRRAKRRGLSLSLDTNWDPADRWGDGLAEALPLLDVFMPNEQEALRISGADSMEDAAAWLRKRVQLTTLKQGAGGATVCTGEQTIHRAVEPAALGGDGIGAGDSFDAGFLAGWLRGRTLAESLEIACVCGRAVAERVGGVQGQPRSSDIPLLRRFTDSFR